jgi:uncharacterized membrane protein
MIYFLTLFIFIPLVLITALTPYLTRKTESFGVSIPEEIYGVEKIRTMRRSYALTAGLFGAAVAAALLTAYASLGESWWNNAFPAAILLYLLGHLTIYLIFHWRMKKLKAQEKWQEAKSEVIAVDTRFRRQKLAFSNWWFALPLFITLITLAITFLLYDKIPAKIPMQYDISGNVTNWADKSYRTVLIMPIVQLYLTALFLFVNTVITRSKQQTDPSQPEKSVLQNVLFRRRWSGFTIISGTALTVLFFLVQLSFIVSAIRPTWLIALSLAIIFFVLAGAIALSITAGQGGSRIKTAGGKPSEHIINRDDDRYWKLGIFYFNPDDPSPWLEKRFGVGWTVNFAHPLGWGSLLLILAVTVLVVVLTV